MASRIYTLFSSGRFNLSNVAAHFNNDCCFGEDLLAWLREKVAAAGYTADEPYQEDWGWEIQFRRDSQRYFVGATGISHQDPVRPDYGEWRVFVEQHRSFKDRLLRRTHDNQLQAEIERLLAAETEFVNVRRDV